MDAIEAAPVNPAVTAPGNPAGNPNPTGGADSEAMIAEPVLITAEAICIFLAL